MERSEDLWRRARIQIEGWLRRYGDPWTRDHCDDLVQETTIAAWRWSLRPHDATRFWAAMQTITRRLRARTRMLAHRGPPLPEPLDDACAPGEPDERHFRIAGRKVPAHRALPILRDALGRLKPIDRLLLRSEAEGFCCAELAVRHGRSEVCIKARLWRARRRVQRDIEAMVRAADSFGW
jgi:DNA-directed RNA polymerase specialized sigma24 family protein